MLDIETLSTKPNAVVLTIGAVKFDPYSLKEPDSGIYLRPEVDQQLADGRDASETTMAWWLKQSNTSRIEAFSDEGRLSLEETHRALNKFLVGVDVIWAQGAVFDIMILENLYAHYGWPTPWNYWQIRDSRTLFSVHGDPRDNKKSEDLHNALADCISQSKAVQKIYRELGLKPRVC
jgi:hypothetical protein